MFLYHYKIATAIILVVYIAVKYIFFFNSDDMWEHKVFPVWSALVSFLE